MNLLYKPIGTVAGVLGGIAAHAVFRQLWRRAAGQDEAPAATSPDYGWREVLFAAASRARCSAWSKHRSTGAGCSRTTG
ncbi:DUF4235 domain-containing protein [Nocardia fusca]|uniref:DUF4235 domain-containing protein n=1 Tax=Nocardia fusca TaxID=941183 RepID=UPI0037AE380F